MPILTCSSETSKSVIDRLRYRGFCIDTARIENETLFLELTPSGAPVCPKCGQRSPKVHDVSYRQVKDVPLISTEQVIVRFPVRRVRCSCGCRAREVIEWVEPNSRITKAMVCLVQNMLRMKLPVSEISGELGLHWDTVKNYDKLLLTHLFDEIDIRGVRHIAIDEFALEKKHKYATVVMDLETSRVIWVSRGKSQDSFSPFFDWVKNKGVQDKILTVSCDMNAAYPRMVKEHLPKAVILYDFFHVMKKFNEEVVVEGKRRCLSLLRDSLRSIKAAKNHGLDPEKILEKQKAAGVLREKITSLTGSQWLIMKPIRQLSEKRHLLLDKLLEDNELLAALYPLVDLLRKIWLCKDPKSCDELIEFARRLLFAINNKHGFAPAKTFATMLKRRKAGIICAGKYGYSSGQLEGANNKIKVLKRTAYGYRDFEYFSLKIKGVLPGKRFSPWDTMKRGYAVLKSGLWNTLPFPRNT